jgi:integrase
LIENKKKPAEAGNKGGKYMPKKKKTVRELNQKLKEVKAYLGRDMNGERVQKSFYGKSLAEAHEKAEEYKQQLKRSEVVDKSIVFADWVERWIKTYKEKNIKSSTYAIKYESFLETHIKPHFKQVKVANIGQIDIQNFINSKAKFTKETQKRYIGILKAIFESAIKKNIIYKNPVKKKEEKSEIIKKKKRTYKQKEADTVIEFAKTHTHGAPIIVLLKTGLRRGELLALKWDDIDFEKDVINLQRSVADIPYEGKLAPIVTEGSNDKKNHNREIPFNEIVRETLSKIKKTSEYIFPNTKGAINSPNNFSHMQYYYFMKDMHEKYPSIAKLNAHELRHTCGTLLYESGVDLRVIQKIMGHSDLKTTSEIYIHDNIDFMKTELEKTN